MHLLNENGNSCGLVTFGINLQRFGP
jgi:hypothetical protein